MSEVTRYPHTSQDKKRFRITSGWCETASTPRKRPPPYDPPTTLGIAYGGVLGECVFL